MVTYDSESMDTAVDCLVSALTPFLLLLIKEGNQVLESISRKKTGSSMRQQVRVPGPPDEQAADPPLQPPDVEPQPPGVDPQPPGEDLPQPPDEDPLQPPDEKLGAPPPQPSETGCITQIAKAPPGQTLPL